MLTEQVEPGLLGGPDIWCSITDNYDHARAEQRRKHGEKFWWYVCTGPKAPYAGLFIDHPAPEMRIWLWQTFQRNIEGILVWETTYWTSSAAYPDAKQPQNPYADPMSWTSGYSTPDGRPPALGQRRRAFHLSAAGRRDAKGDAPVLDGPVDSIRWEHLRDGIEDYEYLCILRRRLARTPPDPVGGRLSKAGPTAGSSRNHNTQPDRVREPTAHRSNSSGRGWPGRSKSCDRPEFHGKSPLGGGCSTATLRHRLIRLVSYSRNLDFNNM